MAIQEITPVGAVGPIQNAEFAQRLFAPVGDNVVAANKQKVDVLSRMAELRSQQNAAVNLEGMRSQNATNLEGLRMQNSQTLADKQYRRDMDLAKENYTRQINVTGQAQKAQDQRDLQKQFSLSYPVYAQSASVLGKTAKPLSQYENSWNGLGQLQADMETLKTEATKQQQQRGAE